MKYIQDKLTLDTISPQDLWDSRQTRSGVHAPIVDPNVTVSLVVCHFRQYLIVIWQDSCSNVPLLFHWFTMEWQAFWRQGILLDNCWELNEMSCTKLLGKCKRCPLWLVLDPKSIVTTLVDCLELKYKQFAWLQHSNHPGSQSGCYLMVIWPFSGPNSGIEFLALVQDRSLSLTTKLSAIIKRLLHCAFTGWYV